MKNYLKLLLPLFILFLLSISSCKKVKYNENSTFGIRHDLSLEQYESIATNLAPYNTSDNPDFSPVICFKYSLNGSSNQEYVATGTLISEEWILTAGHNFYVAEEQSSPALAAGISVLVGLDPDNPNATYEVESLHFHPTWLQDNNDFLNANDLCLVKLKTPVTNVNFATMNLEKNETIGAKIWFSGFGDYSQTRNQNKNESSKKHAFENILDRANDDISTSINGVVYNGGLLAFDFDNPSGTINSLGDEIANSDEAVLGAGESNNTCLDFEATTVTGDSGGPLFIKDGTEWKVAGVLSGGASEPVSDHQDSSYGDISVFIRVSTHKEWIESVIQ